MDAPGLGVGQEDLRDQWLAVNDLIDDGDADGSVPRDVTTTSDGEENGAAFERLIYVDADGCVLLERYIIDGLDHAYSGARSADGSSGLGPDMRRRHAEGSPWAVS